MDGSRTDFPAGAIARLLNITERRVQQLAQEGVIPKSGRGRYPLAGSVQGYVRYLQDHVSRTGGDALELNSERARLAKEQADKTALENEVTRRSLIYRDHMAVVMGRTLTAFRARLLAAAAKLAPRVNPGNPNLARDLIDREHNDALAELADFDPGPEPGAELGEREADVEGPLGDLEAPAAANGQRLGRQGKEAQ